MVRGKNSLPEAMIPAADVILNLNKFRKPAVQNELPVFHLIDIIPMRPLYPSHGC